MRAKICALLAVARVRPGRPGQSANFHDLYHPGWLCCNGSQPELPERLTSRALDQAHRYSSQFVCLSGEHQQLVDQPQSAGVIDVSPTTIRPVAVEQ